MGWPNFETVALEITLHPVERVLDRSNFPHEFLCASNHGCRCCRGILSASMIVFGDVLNIYVSLGDSCGLEWREGEGQGCVLEL